MSLQLTQSAQVITLKGSAKLVAEFFGFGVSSILYQRGVYPPDAFKGKSKYGLTCMVATDPELANYIEQHSQQVEDWLTNGELQRVVVDLVRGCHPYDTLERWTFAVETDQEVLGGSKEMVKPEEEIKKEIAALIRQITSSVTYLPLLDCPCTFVMRFIVAGTASASAVWEENNLKEIANAQDLQLRSFSTKVHKVDTMVTYQVNENVC